MSRQFTTEALDKMYLEYSNLTNAQTRKEIDLQKENEILKDALDSIVDKVYDLPSEERFFCSIKHKESWYSLLARAALEKIKQGK